jgi:hypothetical protein
MDDNVHVDYERWGNAPFLHPPPERPRRTIRATSSALNFASFFRLNYIYKSTPIRSWCPSKLVRYYIKLGFYFLSVMAHAKRRPMLCYLYAMLCYVMLCYAMLSYAMLCYAMLCYAMLWGHSKVHHRICVSLTACDQMERRFLNKPRIVGDL